MKKKRPKNLKHARQAKAPPADTEHPLPGGRGERRAPKGVPRKARADRRVNGVHRREESRRVSEGSKARFRTKIFNRARSNPRSKRGFTLCVRGTESSYPRLPP